VIGEGDSVKVPPKSEKDEDDIGALVSVESYYIVVAHFSVHTLTYYNLCCT
jgi:hypothetical protein